MQEVLHEYVKERVAGRRQTVGVIVGTLVKGQIVTGWAKTNLKAGDKYNKGYGLTLALDRARGQQVSPEIPPQMVRQMTEFRNRCVRYFKQADSLSLKGHYVASNVERELINALPEELRVLMSRWADMGFGGMIMGIVE